MKKFAYFLLAAGFLDGAYVAALDESTVDWLRFSVAAAAAIIGVLLARRATASEARSGEVLESNRSELNESIGNIVRDLDAITNGDRPSGSALLEWIDTKLRNDLRRFAEARESMVHLYGLQAYADIMSEFAAGERYVNRVWSSAADGYDEESQRYLDRAAEQFRHAQSQLAAAGGS